MSADPRSECDHDPGPPAEATWALLVEDDAKLAQLTARYLSSHGVDVTVASDGRRGLELALQRSWDVVLLDIMLPGKDGLAVCRELRAQRDTPIIILTARGEEADRVVGLELGADDYLAKPYSSRELLARIRAQVRRARGQAGPPRARRKVGRLEIDAGTLQVWLDGRPVALTAYEFGLLRVLVEHPGQVLGREQLLDLARGNAEEVFDRSIDGHISRIRQKLGDDPRSPQILKTVRGAGYLLALTGEP
jgi:two-component system, OmpR family, response regulator